MDSAQAVKQIQGKSRVFWQQYGNTRGHSAAQVQEFRLLPGFRVLPGNCSAVGQKREGWTCSGGGEVPDAQHIGFAATRGGAPGAHDISLRGRGRARVHAFTADVISRALHLGLRSLESLGVLELG